jgi:DNA primase
LYRRRIEYGHADRFVFDLEPGEGLEWSFVIETAVRLRDVLARIRLQTWPKLTGEGLHLMAPIDQSPRESGGGDEPLGIGSRELFTMRLACACASS